MNCVTAQMVEDFFHGEEGLDKNMAEAAFNQNRTRINTFYTFVLRRGWVKVDWLANVHSKRVPPTERTRLTPRELIDLPSFTGSERNRAMLTTACNCPGRASELVNIQIKDVRLDRGEIVLRVKKSNLVREMPISQELDAAMRRWLTHYTEAVGPLTEDLYLFPSRGPRSPIWEIDQDGRNLMVGHSEAKLRPTRPMSHPEHVVHEALSAAGFPVLYEGFHTIRRSVARAYYDSLCAQGHDYALRTVMTLLNHSQSSTTERYIGVSTEKALIYKSIRGQSFLGAMVSDKNVLRLDQHRRAGGDS